MTYTFVQAYLHTLHEPPMVGHSTRSDAEARCQALFGRKYPEQQVVLLDETGEWVYNGESFVGGTIEGMALEME